MGRSFTKQEKENIRQSLQDACKQSWIRYGYKKTSVDELCRQVGISKGAFYLFFESKEALFCEVLCQVQQQIRDGAAKILAEYQDKRGAAEALKYIYREYDRHNFLYNADSVDDIMLVHKLSEEQAGRLGESERMSRELFYDRPWLKFKIDGNKAMAVIYALLMNVKNKEILPYDHAETFDFMVDHLIDSLYE